MAARDLAPPLIVIVGPTASGKTSLAIELAEEFGGEIICADSRTVYKYMDIGTAKPSFDEQQRVAHWGLDLVEPGERFTAYDFQQYAVEKIVEIRQRDKIPFLVGGTGLYIDAVILDYEFGKPIDDLEHQRWTGMDIAELKAHCVNNNVLLPENDSNKRHLIHTIEQKSISGKRQSEPNENTLVVGIATEKQELYTRITSRTEQLFENGVVEEATKLGKMYGWESEAMSGNIYPLVHLYLDGQLTLEEIKSKFTTLDRRLAKRQMTWLRRNLFIQWWSLDQARREIASYLATTA